MGQLCDRMIQDLQLAGLSERTVEAYVRSVRHLTRHFMQSPDSLSEDQVREYLLYLKNKKQFGASAQKIAFYGIRFFYRHTVERDWRLFDHFHVMKEFKLPAVLTVDQVQRLIRAVHTPAHTQPPQPSLPVDRLFVRAAIA